MADSTTIGAAGATPGPSGGTQSSPDPALINQIHAEASQAQATMQANDPEDPGTGGIDPRTAYARIQHAQATTAAAVGAGFQFTPEEIEVQLKHCQEQLEDLRFDLQNAGQAAAAVHEPAPDAASVTQANAVRNMLENTANVIRERYSRRLPAESIEFE